jgi:hypothetical protein
LILTTMLEEPTNPPRRSLISGLLALTLLLISCDLSTLVTPAVVPSPIPGVVDTIVAQTAQAAATQTALQNPPTPTPTLTPIPTRTPTLTPSPSPTFIFVLKTLTRVPPVPTIGSDTKEFACQLVGQTPKDDSVMPKKKDFAVTWTVQNTGASSWDASAIDFIYLSGTKLTDLEAVDLPRSVDHGQSMDLKVTMQAPTAAGTYNTVWALRSGKTTFCRVNLTIQIQ